MMVIDNKYNIGDIVYLVTDMEQLARIITGITVYPAGIQYEVFCNTQISHHYDFEMSLEKNILIGTGT